MKRHELYPSIVKAVIKGKLREPFKASDVKKACPGFADKTYSNSLPKHRKGNPGKYKARYRRLAKRRGYKLL